MATAASGYWITRVSNGMEIIVVNTTDKTTTVKIMYAGEDNPAPVRIEANSTGKVLVRFGEMLVCVGFERMSNGEPITDFYECFDKEITPDNLFDEDGDIMYWEISE
jgi:hypothetical protein